jgi:8-oxo-dGTP pyrophosphatase MutT (NUDIX family)
MNEVRAAGAVLWRLGSAGELEVLVIHRARYDDWSFPKGKAENGEDDQACAQREVEEEVGIRPELGPEVGTTSYTDRGGRPKRVRYWAAEVAAGREPRLEDGIDEARWLPANEAARLLSYSRDRELVARLAKVVD